MRPLSARFWGGQSLATTYGWLNLTALILFAFGIFLARFQIPYFLPVIGLACFFIPALNLTYALERLTSLPQELPQRVIWTIIISLTIIPTLAWLVSIFLNGNPLEFALPSFLVTWGGSFLLAVIFDHWSKASVAKIVKASKQELLLLLAIFVAAILGAAVLYPFIPEADSYTYLMKLREVEQLPSSLSTDGRPLFLVLIKVASTVTTIPPYWLLKLALPLLGVVFVLTAYLVARSFIQERSLRLIAALSPLYFPVIFQELLISRPQSIALLVLVPALYFYGRISLARENSRGIYWLIALIIMGVVGLQIHTVFALVVVLGLVAVVVFYLPQIIRRPLDSALLILGVSFALYPWVSRTNLISDTLGLSHILITTVKNHPFIWWFLDNYRNVDGNEAGWPGLSALFYYGYNLGLFLPGLLILLLWSKKKAAVARALKTPSLWPIWLTLLFFFVIAEILPRFGLAFLPDRAWLLLTLALSLLIPALVQFPVTWLTRRLLTILAILAIVSSWGLTYLKAGWIASADYPAVNFIRAHTPNQSVFLTQGGNHVLVRYFASRVMVRPPTEVLTSTDPNAVGQYLDQQYTAYRRELQVNLEQRAAFQKELDRIDKSYENASAPNQLILRDQRAVIEGGYAATLENEQAIQRTYPTLQGPIYLLYSRNKFQTFYANRSWWRTSNFYGIDLEKFSKRYPVVYNQGGVVIWKVRD